MTNNVLFINIYGEKCTMPEMIVLFVLQYEYYQNSITKIDGMQLKFQYNAII